MYVRYKKNIQENDLPRKRVRKASKIAGSGGQYLEIRCPERGRKHCPCCLTSIYLPFGNKMPREGTETFFHPFNDRRRIDNLEIRCPERGRKQFFQNNRIVFSFYLEIRCPERGRKPLLLQHTLFIILFGNKMPREGTETTCY